MRWWSERWMDLQVNGTLLPYKLYYLALFSGLACMSPFLPVFFRLRGLTESQIGFLGFLQPVMGIPTVPLWSALADQLGLQKAILLGTTLGSALLRFLYIYPPSFAIMIPLVAIANALGGAPNVLADAFTMEALEDKTEYGKQRLWGAVGWGLAAPLCGAVVTATRIELAFCLHLVFMTLAAVVATQFRFKGTHTDSKTYSQLGEEILLENGETDLERHVEILTPDSPGIGTIGSPSTPRKRFRPGSQSPSAGSIFRSEPPLLRTISGQNPALVSFEATRDGLESDDSEALLATKQPEPFDRPPANDSTAPIPKPFHSDPFSPPSKDSDVPPPEPQTILDPPLTSKLGALFRKPSVCSFFLVVSLMGVGMGTIEGFLPLRLHELGGSPTLIGLTLTMTCVAEVPMMWFSGRLIKRLGVLGVLYLVLGCYVARLAYYSVLVEPWAVLPIELLHGVTFGCGWTAGTVHAGRIAPPGMAATMQALFAGAYSGIGDGLGMLLGGFVYEHYGSVTLFRGCGLLVAGGALLFGLSQRWFPLEDGASGTDREGEQEQELVPLEKPESEA
ncbi:major facilitator superfamily protein [Klebsormidium nitens]|uniref:Major facilitator superfamily protein n=1 Tax=Klebsormidium nitens TaxID=105231 RepID=A0A1Y1HPL2_KLENI|nr:major facilitator superfamily protein [Klebsormidium nitens]|eukprot:GAQ79149.1 major facilitator superfamily protein [Klebsormidium nitens]